MPKYVIERDIPGAGAFNAEQLKAISQKILWRIVENGRADPVGTQLRDGRQNILRLQCTK
jgi:hypothetical protein